MLWECYLTDPNRQVDPCDDPILKLVWTGFERLLLARFPATGRLVTPSWEDIVRRIVGDEIPFSERRGSEDQTSGSPAYLAAKANGDNRMP